MAKASKPIIKSSIAQEPWRFMCESCSSVALAVRNRKQPNKSNKKVFYCQSCNTRSKYAYDKQSGHSYHINEILR